MIAPTPEVIKALYVPEGLTATNSKAPDFTPITLNVGLTVTVRLCQLALALNELTAVWA